MATLFSLLPGEGIRLGPTIHNLCYPRLYSIQLATKHCWEWRIFLVAIWPMHMIGPITLSGAGKRPFLHIWLAHESFSVFFSKACLNHLELVSAAGNFLQLHLFSGGNGILWCLKDSHFLWRQVKYEVKLWIAEIYTQGWGGELWRVKWDAQKCKRYCLGGSCSKLRSPWVRDTEVCLSLKSQAELG